MSLQDSRAELSPEEELAAEQSLALYCRPVELYNITQRRAIKNPLFLQRNLLYKIHARQKKRIELTISLSGSANTKVQELYYRSRDGNVVFNYKYYNDKLQKTEVTEDFSCPFCLVQCRSFKGLGFHLNSTHDLFSFEFVMTKQNQIVNVSMKDDVLRTELVVAEGVHPRHQTFSYFSRSKRCRQLVTTTEKLKHVHSHIMESRSPEDVHGGSEDDCVQKDNEHASADPAHYSAHGSNLSQPTVLQFDEQADLRNRQLLQKRQFFHSQRSQPMALEQVFSEHDSEDEVDEDIADYDNKRMLDDYVGVSKDEKQIMHMWNSFVKKQRVLADRHVPWACEAFSRLHGQELVQNTALLWCWRFFMIKLWNHNLLDARTMNTCNIILQGFQDGSSGAK